MCRKQKGIGINKDETGKTRLFSKMMESGFLVLYFYLADPAKQ